jgi:ribosomal protein S18 acetylase RimI-like enzyme
MQGNQFIIRRMSETDLDIVLKIQSQSYIPFFHESKAVFSEKLKLFPNGCCIGYLDNDPVAYLFSHPWSQELIVELDTPLKALPNNPDCYYIHDLSVSSQFHRKGIGKKMFSKAKELTIEYHFTKIVLVAVQGSQNFWAKFGFRPIEKPSETIKAKLQSYGQGSCVMMMSYSQ